MTNLLIEDLDLDVLPGGAGEPVLHVRAVMFVIAVLTEESPAH